MQLKAISGYGPSLFVNDLYVEENTPGCVVPSNLVANIVSCDSIIINWSGASDTSLFVYVPTGTIPTSANMVVGDSSFTITGTSPNTAYDVYVANICDGDTSFPAGPVTFNTGNIGAPKASFTYTVNGYSVVFDGNSSTGMGNTYSWDFGDTTSGTGLNSSHTYSNGGNVAVKLTVTNACGTSDTTITIAGISLEEISLGASVAVYPNPAKDAVNLEINLEDQDAVTVKVLSVSGKLMLSKTYDSSTQIKDQLNLSNLSDGVYMIKVETSKGSVNKRLLKK